MSREDILPFIESHGGEIAAMVDEAAAIDCTGKGPFAEVGCLVSGQWELSERWTEIMTRWNQDAGRWDAEPVPDRLTFWQVWAQYLPQYRLGYIHTHPFWMPDRSPRDIELMQLGHVQWFLTCWRDPAGLCHAQCTEKDLTKFEETW